MKNNSTSFKKSVQVVLAFLLFICHFSISHAQLSGTYTIDANGSGPKNFKTFTAAIDTLNNDGVNGQIVFNVANGVYNEWIDIELFSGIDSANPILFQSAAGDSSKVIIEYSSDSNINPNSIYGPLVFLSGVSYINFKNMTFIRTGKGSNGTVFELHASHVIVKNCVVRSTNNHNGNQVFNGDIALFGDSFSITNNLILNGINGIYAEASGSIISANNIDSFSSQGIVLEYVSDFIVQNNFLETVYSYWQGIDVEGNNFIIKNNTVLNTIRDSIGGDGINATFDSNFTINNNHIINATTGIEMDYPAGSVKIANNMISAYDNGLLITFSTANMEVYFNSIMIHGYNNLIVGNSDISTYSLFTNSNFKVMDNILTNLSGSYIYNLDQYSSNDVSIDYNDYYLIGLAFAEENNYDSSFSDWQSSTGYDVHSLNINPKFIDSFNVTTTNALLAGKGIAISGITTDINGVTRPNPPTIGANEINLKPDTLRGIITTSKGVALKNQWLYELVYNSSDSILSAVDSTKTDTDGHYVFYTNISVVYLLAVPDSSDYPNEMRTYYDSALIFQSASLIYPKWGTTVINFSTIGSSYLTGGSFIDGKITVCICKKPGIGQPVPNLRVILVDSQNNPVRESITNIKGDFGFSKLIAGTYKVWVDYPHVDNSLAPVIKLAADTTVKKGLLFLLYPTYLFLDSIKASIEPISNSINNLTVYPNPFTSAITISYSLPQIQKVLLFLTDITGKQIATLANENQNPGQHIYTLDAEKYNIPAGMYFLQMVAGNEAVEQKIVRIR